MNHAFSTFGAAAVLALGLGACTEREMIAMDAAEPTLYERLGGQEAIVAVVDDFVANVAADERINGFFANTDIEALKASLVDQVCEAAGGPCAYEGEDMKTAHAGLGITEEHFNAMGEDMLATLETFEVPERETNELMSLLGSMQGDIVGQ
jgi:hemoglobin